MTRGRMVGATVLALVATATTGSFATGPLAARVGVLSLALAASTSVLFRDTVRCGVPAVAPSTHVER